MRTVLSFLLLVIFAGTSITFGQTTYDFLRVDMSARAAALGGSFVTNNDDVDVIFYNPSGMNFLEKRDGQGSFETGQQIKPAPRGTWARTVPQGSTTMLCPCVSRPLRWKPPWAAAAT